MKTAYEILKEAESLPAKDDLTNHLETIAVLRGKRWTWRDIAKFLSERGVEVDHTKVYRFAKANEEQINKVAQGRVNMSQSNQAVVPTANEYLEALQAIKINEAQKKMLAAHYHAHNRSITYTELANAAGSESHVFANKQYGTLGKILGEKLGFKFLKSKTRDKLFFSSSIGADNPNISEDDEHYQLVMHHELAKALDKLSWFQK